MTLYDARKLAIAPALLVDPDKREKAKAALAAVAKMLRAAQIQCPWCDGEQVVGSFLLKCEVCDGAGTVSPVCLEEVPVDDVVAIAEAWEEEQE